MISKNVLKSYVTLLVFSVLISCTKGVSLENGKIVIEEHSPANCYVVKPLSTVKFSAVRGNTDVSVGEVAAVSVLWESFGTDTKPSIGDIVKSVNYTDGKIEVEANKNEGNAVVAAIDESGNILWSWHIWVTSSNLNSLAQTYSNGAGKFMDRNLGATSSRKGDVKSLGLVYQWGRKDPFLNSCSIDGNDMAESTVTWPGKVGSTSKTGTPSFVQMNPMVVVTQNKNNHDWYWSDHTYTDVKRWNEKKGEYDPCPPGWRVPDLASLEKGWSKAFDQQTSFKDELDTENKGFDFGSTDKKLGLGTIWYPATGRRNASDGKIYCVGDGGYYWSCSSGGYLHAKCFSFYQDTVKPVDSWYRAYLFSVRCMAE